ncbi:hypothetical protein A3C26_00385 [Candidatus Daviesbacteria bacterium RIFCSPHIGHO2_02_FULL_39_12]|uniref:Uncharacterized protein n=2 Tax=Candidatus Daviesiibacteriota TaxID=1752718 RepID=A0A1F5J8N0_9BACT|nr:MAG: hypothetical protein A3C26_00385 [Candidatus Daviesbacteria bacterium RIFCSPHIGHO2_02_FULL_39_12]OGE72304.1 MAG: hypothetical protein A3H40_02315 [Candidatus Daviesbacteria bacterium RIFCSPLOWO2_02_FULL_38_15]
MLRLLPVVLVITLVLGGLGYWRFVGSKPSLISSETSSESDSRPIEVPKTLPQAGLEERIKALESLTTKLVVQETGSSDSRVSILEASVTELKARVSTLEKATPAPAASTGQSVVYIPLGSGGGPWKDQSWYSLSEYQVILDPANYPNYSSMQLEANFRLNEAASTGSVRLYNVTDSNAVSSQIDTTSTSFGIKTSSTFKLPSGQKTYTIQVKSDQNAILFVQNARIKVNF